MSKEDKSHEKDHASKHIDQNIPPYPYVISLKKLIILSVTTFGLYDIYWFYKHFKSFNRELDWNINVWLRTIFVGIMSFSLFRKISDNTALLDKNWTMNPIGLWLAYIILNKLWKLPDPYWLLCFLSVLPLVQTQYNINLYWEKKYGQKVIKSKFGTGNYIWAVVGGILLILTVLATFFPE